MDENEKLFKRTLPFLVIFFAMAMMVTGDIVDSLIASFAGWAVLMLIWIACVADDAFFKWLD